VLGFMSRNCFRLLQPGFHLLISDRVISGMGILLPALLVCFSYHSASLITTPSLVKTNLKAGVYLSLSEVLGSLKRDLTEKKVLEHDQTVECPSKGRPRLVDNCLV